MCIKFAWNKKLLIPILFPLFVFIRRFERINIKDFNPTSFFQVFANFASMTICGIFYLMSLCLSKSEKSEINNLVLSTIKIDEKNEFINIEKDNDNQFNIERRKTIKNAKKIKWGKHFFFVGIFFLIFIANLIQYLIKEELLKKNILEKQFRQNIAVLLEIIFLFCFSSLILKYNIRSMKKHQIISLILIFLCLFVFSVLTIIYSKLNFTEILINCGYYGSMQFAYILSDVLGKKYLEKYSDGVYKFLFKIGFIGSIIIILIDLIFNLIINKGNSLIYEEFEKNKFYIVLLDIFLGMPWLLGLWLTLYIFNPFHFIILESLTELFGTISNLIEDKYKENKNNDEYYKFKQKICFYCLYPIIILGVLVFNEIIILKFCNFSYDTREEIMKRQLLEIEDEKNIDTKIIPGSLNNDDDEDEDEDENDNDSIINDIIEENNS